MLTVAAIEQLALKHGLKLIARYPTIADGVQPPQPTLIIIWFHEVCAEAWKTLTTSLTEVPVSIHGTRQMTGSGSTDGRLFPAYEALLGEVNATRAAIGLGRIFG